MIPHELPAPDVAGVRPIVAGRQPTPSAEATPGTAGAHVLALDGLRGLAILLVLFRHTSWRMEPVTDAGMALYGAMRLGWIGVDLFFVLSGFLITGILVDSKGGDHYFRNFYMRRSLRIFPLYYAFLAGFFLLLPLLTSAEASGLRTLRENQPWLWGYLTNVLVSIEGTRATPLGMTHLWSLAVEEQFYLVWPAVVLWCDRQRLISVCLWMGLAALAVRVAVVATQGGGDVAGYMLTPARMDTLAFGALLALWMREPGARAQVFRWVGPVAAALVGALLVLVVSHRGLPQLGAGIQTVGYTVIALLATCLLAMVLAAPERSPLRRAFEMGWLRSLGKYSYAMYVFHYPLLILAARRAGFSEVPALWGSKIPTQLLITAGVAAASFVLAWASWHLFEKHFLKLKRYFPTPQPRPDTPRPGVDHRSPDESEAGAPRAIRTGT